jgi:adenylate cyclase
VIFPLRVKLALLASGLLVAGIATVALLLLEQSSQALELEARKRGQFLADSLARNARDPMLLEDDLVLGQVIETVAQESEVLLARVVGPQGQILMSSRPEDAGRQARLAGDEDQTIHVHGTNLVVASRMSFGEVDLGEAQVVLDLDAIVGSVLERARRGVLLASGALLLVGVLFAIAVSGRITRPLVRLRMAVRALAAGDTSARVEVTTRDEIAVLARAFNEMGESLNEKRKIETAFRRYVSDHVLQEVVDRPEAVHFQGERREVTVLFIDIRGFTQLSSSIGPERLVGFLNEAFERITNCLLDHGATVDKYLGDAILAYIGAPILSSDHAERAVASAIAIQRSVQERNQAAEALGEPFEHLEVGIGIQTGPVLLGNIGSELKMDYTAIGDPVNVANRLQKLAGPGQILITEDVANHLGARLELKNLGTRELEGRDGPVTIYEVPH